MKQRHAGVAGNADELLVVAWVERGRPGGPTRLKYAFGRIHVQE